MADEPIIREFRPVDQEAARAVILAGLEEHWGVLDLTLNSDVDDLAGSYADGCVLVAEWGGELVGTGVLSVEPGGIGRIQRMSVARSARRRGIATSLLRALEDEARRRGYPRLVLETTSTWQDAIGFYAANGYQPVDERDGDTHFVKALG